MQRDPAPPPRFARLRALVAVVQLIAVDAAYLGLLAVVNFCFPYVLLPVAFNPMQLLLPPSDVTFPSASTAATAASNHRD